MSDDAEAIATEVNDRAFGPQDLAYIEAVVAKLYDSEIDRKDKILSSVSVIAPTPTVLSAAVAFLFGSVLDTTSDYLSAPPDIVVVVYWADVVAFLTAVVLMVTNFWRLLAGENYTYVSDAVTWLEDSFVLQDFCKRNGLAADREVAALLRQHLVVSYAASATRNCRANDIRLFYRQRVLRYTMLALVTAAIGLVAVVLHRERPHIWAVPLGRSVHDG